MPGSRRTDIGGPASATLTAAPGVVSELSLTGTVTGNRCGGPGGRQPQLRPTTVTVARLPGRGGSSVPA